MSDALKAQIERLNRELRKADARIAELEELLEGAGVSSETEETPKWADIQRLLNIMPAEARVLQLLVERPAGVTRYRLACEASPRDDGEPVSDATLAVRLAGLRLRLAEYGVGIVSNRETRTVRLVDPDRALTRLLQGEHIERRPVERQKRVIQPRLPRLLQTLVDHGAPMTSQDLKRATGMNMVGVGNTIRDALSRSYLANTYRPDGRKGYYVTITDKGRAFLDRGGALVTQRGSRPDTSNEAA